MTTSCRATFLQNGGSPPCYVADVDWKTLPHVLKGLRKSAGLTMKELGSRLDVTYQAIDNYEGGRRTPDPAIVDAFIQACGKKLVFEIVDPAAQVAVLDPTEQEVVSTLRLATAEQRRALLEFARLLPRAREGAERAALSVLRQLQTPTETAPRALGEPE